MPRALALYSGSLASVVAVKLFLLEYPDWGIDLLYIRTPYRNRLNSVKASAERFFPHLGFYSCGLKRDFVSGIAKADEFGFPCGFCRFLLMRKALRYVRRKGYAAIVTGDLAPPSRELSQVLLVDKLLGLDGLVRRPLFSLSGERELRKLAADLGVYGFDGATECPMRDPGFAHRVKFLYEHFSGKLNTIFLAQFPHLYAADDFIFVVAISIAEQRRLHTYFLPDDVRLYVDRPGSPLGLLRFRDGNPGERFREVAWLCACILGSYFPSLSGVVDVILKYESSNDRDRILVTTGRKDDWEAFRLPDLSSQVDLVYFC